MHKIIKVKVLKNYQLQLKYSNGQSGIVDLADHVGKGVFALWNDYKKFKNVKIGDSGELIWSDSVDLCPDALYLKMTGLKPEDIFPNLKKREKDLVNA